jgi:hypothetical protein
MSKLETNTIDNISGSSTLNLGDTNATAITIDSGVGNLTIPNGISTGQNYPAFYARKTGNQTMSRGTITKLTTFTTDEIDTDSAFDGTTFTVPVAGKYLFGAQFRGYFGDAGNDGEVAHAYIYKNGSVYAQNLFQMSGSGRTISTASPIIHVIMDCAVDDTVEFYARIADNSASGTLKITDTQTFFQGFRIGA